VNRLGLAPDNFFAMSHEDIPNFQPLNTPAGRAAVELVVTRIGGVDLIVFDNCMCLITGDQREEEGWSQVMPWIRKLTARSIGQIWVHHTGHDESRSYGTKTREWQLDTVAHMTEVPRPDTDVSFALEFKKARERTPATRKDFETVRVALVKDQWTVEHGGGVAGKDWPKSLRVLRQCIQEAMQTSGVMHQPSDGNDDWPAVQAVEVKVAREFHQRRYVSRGEKDRTEAERKAWRRHLDKARNDDLIKGEALDDGRELIWIANQGA
jgi:hypothetical protein